MKYEYGDVVLYDGAAYIVIGVDSDYEIVTLMNETSYKNDILMGEIKKLGHEDGFSRNITSILTKHTYEFNNKILKNQETLAALLAGDTFSNGCIEYYFTGLTKVNGNHLYCQVRDGNLYDWVLMETTINKLFCK